MKKAMIVSCFDWYETRLKYVKTMLEKKEYRVQIFQSDFNHVIKKKVNHIEKYQMIHVPPYKKNLSSARIKSHLVFSKKVKELVNELKPDLIYALIPLNSVGKVCAEYKVSNPQCKLVLDIIDMWPESMPIKKFEKIPLIRTWKSWRNKAIMKADYVFTECELYQQMLKEALIQGKYSTLYLCQDSVENIDRMLEPRKKVDGKITFCYLGSINSIIDIESIKAAMKKLRDKGILIHIHVIGDGESRENFIEELESLGCSVDYHGKIFEEEKKMEIMSECEFGINMMKSSVSVGLTIKSIDYLKNGLLLFNTIKGDTWRLVEQGYGVNINLDDNKWLELVVQNEKLKTPKEIMELYNQNFTCKAFMKQLNQGLEKIL